VRFYHNVKRLWCIIHLAVRGGNDNDSTIHACGTSDHVLDVIGVTRAVNVGIVPGLGLVLDVRSRDGDTTLALLGSLVNGAILEEGGKTLLGLTLGDGGSQCGLVETVRFGHSGEGGKEL